MTAILGAGLLCWVGCSVEKHYQLLSFFFDGVPDPHAPKEGELASSASTRPSMRTLKSARVSVHKPFLEDKCTECHTQGRTQLSAQMDSRICINCHQKELTKFAAMHGPVVGQACMWCHDPHESSLPSLLRTDNQSLCMQCHERETMTAKVPEHTSTSSKCLDCHFGHGSDKPPFLKPNALAATARPASGPSTAPATSPSTQPADSDILKSIE